MTRWCGDSATPKQRSRRTSALRAKIKKVITTEGISAGSHVQITVTHNASIKHYGTGWVYTGVLVEDGNWLVVPGNRDVSLDTRWFLL